jgi:hypothetical protein
VRLNLNNDNDKVWIDLSRELMSCELLHDTTRSFGERLFRVGQNSHNHFKNLV